MVGSTGPRHRFAHPVAWQLASVHDPLAFFNSLPATLRSDPSFICEALAVMTMSRNTTELARRVGMSRMGLRKAMEPGANPSFTTIARVADALGLKLELLAA